MSLSCLDVAGAEIAAVDIAIGESLDSLVEAIAKQSPNPGHWRLILPNGRVLDDPAGTSTLAELLQGAGLWAT